MLASGPLLLLENQKMKLPDLPFRRNKRGKRNAKDLLPNPALPFECMQTDNQYIYILGEHRNALLITVLDVFSRGVLTYKLEYSITRHPVIDLMKDVLYHYKMPAKVSQRTDNVSQFEAGLFREYLQEMSIEDEFTHVATPQQNCYIDRATVAIFSLYCGKCRLCQV